MSSFIDNLRRENKGSDKLQYDDGAFYYFSTALVCIILVPMAISIISNFFKKTNKFKHEKDLPPKFFGKDLAPMLKKKESSSRFDRTFIYKILLAAFLLFIYSQAISNVEKQKELKGFDPYDILEVPLDCEDAELIKKNYRKLSLKYHPDRNPDDPEAVIKFQQLTKAYECLTDEKAKENWKKYGNPEGDKSFSIGIAMPSFLLAKENRVPILVTFFIFILVVIPYFVISWYNEVSKYDQDGVLIENRAIFASGLNENLITKNVPKFICLCVDFHPILSVAPEQRGDLHKLKTQVDDKMGMPFINDKLADKSPLLKYSKPYYLLSGFMLGCDIGPTLLNDLLLILQSAPLLFEVLTKIAIMCPRLPLPGRPNESKAIGLRCALNAVECCQAFNQGVWIGDHPYLQIFDKHTVELLL